MTSDDIRTYADTCARLESQSKLLRELSMSGADRPTRLRLIYDINDTVSAVLAIEQKYPWTAQQKVDYLLAEDAAKERAGVQ